MCKHSILGHVLISHSVRAQEGAQCSAVQQMLLSHTGEERALILLGRRGKEEKGRKDRKERKKERKNQQQAKLGGEEAAEKEEQSSQQQPTTGDRLTEYRQYFLQRVNKVLEPQVSLASPKGNETKSVREDRKKTLIMRT